MIHFVGAGPGAPDLITIRGKELLERADVIIYAGSLVNKALLDYAKPNCEVYNSAGMTLDEVITAMVRAANKGGEVVRLHTGYPCLYGAAREQMDALEQEGLEYCVTPGVSSFCGTAAALKAEYTLPDVSQTVIITRLAGRTPVPEKENIPSLAAHGATMVIFLSTGMLDALREQLLEGGYKKDTPAAIVYKATWPDQKIVHCTVDTLPMEAKRNNINKTAMITVGDFLGNDYGNSKLYDAGFTHGFREAGK